MIGRKGVISRYEDRKDATTTTELSQIGQSYLRYKGSPEIILTIESLNDIWNIGQKVEFNNAPLNELATEYMVKKKTIHYIPTVDNIFYEFELTSNFNSENAINYFEDFYTDFDSNKAKKLLKDLDLDINQELSKMSKGMQEKVQLVLVMSRKADLYILDEPLGGVDPATRDYILDTI